MNHYNYDDIAIGHIETFAVEIDDKMMSDFYIATGDLNSMHKDENYAKSVGYKSKIAYGMLTASFLSTLAGTYLPGKYSLIQKIEVEFPAPVYVGDKIVFIGEVVRKYDNFKTIELKVTAKNDSGKKVLRAKMRVGVLK